MIDRSLFEGWARRHHSTGIELFRAAMPGHGVVRVTFPAAPVLPAARVVGRQLREMRRSSSQVRFESGGRGTTGPTDSFVMCSLIDEIGQAQRHLGLIYTDRLMAMVVGHFMSRAADVFRPLVDALTKDFPMRHGGPLRFRRFLHAKPNGWATRTRDLTTYLIAPRTEAIIEILPAEPFGASSVTTRFIYEDVNLTVQPGIEEREHTTPWGITGALMRSRVVTHFEPTQVCVAGALLADDSFNYVVRYRAEARYYEKHMPELLRLVDSIQPVPRMQSDLGANNLKSYWVD